MVQLSHLHMTTGKTLALTIQTFVSKMMSLVFNTLSRLVIAFLPRSKGLLISWLQSLSAVISEPKKMKSLTVSISSLSICHEVMEPDAMILDFWMLSFNPAFFHSLLSPLWRLPLHFPCFIYIFFCHNKLQLHTFPFYHLLNQANQFVKSICFHSRLVSHESLISLYRTEKHSDTERQCCLTSKS